MFEPHGLPDQNQNHDPGSRTLEEKNCIHLIFTIWPASYAVSKGRSITIETELAPQFDE